MTAPQPASPPGRLHERVRRHHADLVAFLERKAPGHGEELAQETWFRLARARPELPTDDDLRAYAFAVGRRLLIDHHRRRLARVELIPAGDNLDHTARAPDDPHAAAAAGDVLAVVQRTLDAMKPELAEVFRLRTTDDVPFQEIAARQGTGLNTALGRMHQAVRHLHSALSRAGLIGEDR